MKILKNVLFVSLLSALAVADGNLDAISSDSANPIIVKEALAVSDGNLDAISSDSVNPIIVKEKSDNHNGFIGVTLTSDSECKPINMGDDTGMYGLLFGNKKLISDSLSLGGYLNMSSCYNVNTETDGGHTTGEITPTNSVSIFNTGITYTPIESLSILGGIGYNKYDDKHTKESQVNYNLAVMYNFGHIGITVGYNTVPDALNYGVVFSF